jgi:hypothetical protein
MAMTERIKKSWRLFEASPPGRRFRERYHRRQRASRGTFTLSKVLYILGGLALIVVSTLFGWLPVLGWGTVALGLGMIAGEFKPAATLMDWLEVRLRRLFRPVARGFRRLSPLARLAVSGTIALLTFGLVYAIYRSTFGG